MKYSSILVLIFFLFSCQDKSKNEETQIKLDSTSLIGQKQIIEAQAWLTQAIESFFNQNRTDISEICTPEYEEYKMDAINVDFDGGMSEEQFQKKWAGKYNTNLDQIGKSFLLEGQDNGRIKVLKCEPDSDSTLVFYTEIQDLDFKVLHKKTIKVVNTTAGFKIDDIK